MSVMFGAMAFMRRIDQEEPKVLLYARIFYAAYVAVTLFIYGVLHLRILSRRNLTLVTVPVAPKRPSFSEAMEKASAEAEARAAALEGNSQPAQPKEEEQESEEEKNKTEVITAMEYDLRQLAHARKSWITNACILTAINYKMESVSPLIMSALMGIVRLLSDEPLFQIYVRGSPAVGSLKRPFAPEKSPFATLMKEMAPKPEDSMATAGTTATRTAPSGATVDESDLHDDGDSEEDSPPRTIADMKDDHIKSDFDDEESKKDL